MSSLEAELVRNARRRILEQVAHLPAKRDNLGLKRTFTNANGADVTVTTNKEIELARSVDIDIRMREFDPRLPYDPKRIHEYHTTYSIGPDDTLWFNHHRYVFSFPQGYERSKPPKMEKLAHLGHTRFWATHAVVSSARWRRQWSGEVQRMVGLTERSFQAASLVHGRDRQAYVLSAPPGLEITLVPGAASPVTVVDDLVNQTKPAIGMKIGTGWTPNAAQVSGWNDAFRYFASHYVTQNNLDIEEVKNRIADLQAMAAAQTDFESDLSYATKAVDSHYQNGD